MTSLVFVYPVGASIDMVQVLSMEIAKSHSRQTASKSAASICRNGKEQEATPKAGDEKRWN